MTLTSVDGTLERVERYRQRGRARARRRSGGGLGRMVGKRVLLAIPVLWGVTFLTFLIMNALPGDAAAAILGTHATPQQIHHLYIELGLNKPFLVRYGNWLSGVVQGNLGTSLASGKPVGSLLVQRLPVTSELVLYSFVILIVLAIPTATICAARPGGIFDRIVMVTSMVGLSMAGFVFALLLILVFAVDLRIFPAIGWVAPGTSFGGNLKALFLPAVSIGAPLACFYTRLLRADIIEQMDSQDYIVTAKAKGLGKWRMLIRHALRNSVFGMITLMAIDIGTLFGGTVVIEEIFAIPGIGYGVLSAIQTEDIPVVEGGVLFFAFAVVIFNLLADVLNAVLDPRIRDGRPVA